MSRKMLRSGLLHRQPLGCRLTWSPPAKPRLRNRTDFGVKWAWVGYDCRRCGHPAKGKVIAKVMFHVCRPCFTETVINPLLVAGAR